MELTDEQILAIESDQARRDGVDRKNLTLWTVRAALIAQNGFCLDDDQCTCAREIGYRVCQPSGMTASEPMKCELCNGVGQIGTPGQRCFSCDGSGASKHQGLYARLELDFSTRLTPYGMLVRALRIVANTTLYDMAKHLSSTPAELSSIEFGRKPVTNQMLSETARYFSGLDIDNTLQALSAAREAK